jgi:hypothetical protein
VKPFNTDWSALLAASADRVAAARSAHEQLIRDAASAGTTVVDIAAALGTTDRGVVYRVLQKPPAQPRLAGHTPAVYLRGAGVDTPTWKKVETAMSARGWVNVHTHTTAFHLARGGPPVVLVNFSASLKRDGDRFVSVWRVRPVFHNPKGDELVDDLAQEMQLQPTLGADLPAPYRRIDPDDGITPGTGDGGNTLDEQALARMVAHVLSLSSNRHPGALT